MFAALSLPVLFYLLNMNDWKLNNLVKVHIEFTIQCI